MEEKLSSVRPCSANQALMSALPNLSGSESVLQICQISPAKGYTHFLYGGNQDVAEDLARSLQARYPGLKVATAGNTRATTRLPR